MGVDLFQATWWPLITGVCCTAAGATLAGRTCCDTWRAPTWTGMKSCLASGYSAVRSGRKYELWKWPHFNRLLYNLMLGGWELWVKLNVALEKRSVMRAKCKDIEISHDMSRAKSPTLKQPSINITWTMQRLRKTPWFKIQRCCLDQSCLMSVKWVFLCLRWRGFLYFPGYSTLLWYCAIYICCLNWFTAVLLSKDPLAVSGITPYSIFISLYLLTTIFYSLSGELEGF